MDVEAVGDLLPGEATTAEAVNGLLLGLSQTPDKDDRDQNKHQDRSQCGGESHRLWWLVVVAES